MEAFLLFNNIKISETLITWRRNDKLIKILYQLKLRITLKIKLRATPVERYWLRSLNHGLLGTVSTWTLLVTVVALYVIGCIETSKLYILVR